MSNNIKRALVLGCGGVAGGAWTIPTLANLQQQLDWDAREADIIIGTSVGALLGSLIGAGVAVDTLLASQKGETRYEDFPWDHNNDWGNWYPPIPQPGFSAAQLIQHGLADKVSMLTAICGAMPKGRMPLDAHNRIIRHFVGESQWVKHKATWIVAVEDSSGKRIPFGHRSAPDIPIDKAVRASYAVPGWCPPVKHNGNIYLDGGIASPTSADLLIEEDVDEVIILAPMSSSQLDSPDSRLAKIERKARRYMTSIVDQEIQALTATGKRVIRLEPGPEDLNAIGFNMMDYRRREQVLKTSLNNADKRVKAALSVG